jgi:hypothetical protein
MSSPSLPFSNCWNKLQHQYETKSLADNQVKVQPATTDSYSATTKALAEKQTEFHTYKPK